MKKTILTCFLGSMLLVSCSKDDPATPSADVYMNFDAGASWDYRVVNNTAPSTTTDYTVVSTNRDTTLGGRIYHVFETSDGGFEFYAKEGANYHTYYSFPDPINQEADFLYLKDNAAVGTSWTAATMTVDVGLPVNIVVTNSIAAKGLTRTVNGVTYNNVTHVKAVITAPGLPVTINSDINFYFAPKYGQIESSIIMSSTAFPTEIDTDSFLMDASF